MNWIEWIDSIDGCELENSVNFQKSIENSSDLFDHRILCVTLFSEEFIDSFGFFLFFFFYFIAILVSSTCGYFPTTTTTMKKQNNKQTNCVSSTNIQIDDTPLKELSSTREKLYSDNISTHYENKMPNWLNEVRYGLKMYGSNIAG